MVNQESHLVVKFHVAKIYSFYITTDLIDMTIGTFEQGRSDDAKEHSKAMSLRAFFNVFRYICDTEIISSECKIKNMYTFNLYIFRGSSAKNHLNRIIKYIDYIHPHYVKNSLFVEDIEVVFPIKDKAPQLFHIIGLRIKIGDNVVEIIVNVYCDYNNLHNVNVSDDVDFVVGMCGRNIELSGVLVL